MNSTKMFQHKSQSLKQAYMFTFKALKEIKYGMPEDYFVDMLKLEKYPSWLYIQIKKLIRRRIKDLRIAHPRGKRIFEFSLIMPKKNIADYLPDFNLSNEKEYVKHVLFNSRTFFITCGTISNNTFQTRDGAKYNYGENK